MPRRLVAFILSLVLSCYGFAAVAKALVLTSGDDHAVAHLLEQAHHHHDDGSVHVDDSDESVQHVMVDQWLGAPAMPAEPPALPHLRLVAASPPDHSISRIPTPYLEGPRRPPRSSAD
ncbi:MULTISPECIES: hypothetical protein [unclassified Tepidimonas]|uniref:hypothetical protein n=1 Tax=unclassified Tepidimonas TaxID=2631705 RepID=UPI003C7AD492